ncbi:MAG TPA: class I SAM-dependent methyltransferase [Solirubrobacteraceae bacterium]|jgi:ubiquinone/menaquinone biosynthesis C-methylase UbiE
MSSRAARFPGRELLDELGSVVPGDHSRQRLAEDYIERRLGAARTPWRVLDLGCGDGGSVDRFRSVDPEVRWVGLDVPDSPEVRTRRRGDAEFQSFDGVTIPFPEASFDLVYCRQVLEHVRHPEPLLAEVRRVLAPGGCFAGSTSQLEPYHSLSIWNFTPAGFCTLIGSAGLEPVEVRPGIDGVALISVRLFGSSPPRWLQRQFAKWWATRSPLNALIDLYARVAALDPQATNATKLVLCGAFTFLARRPRGETTLPASPLVTSAAPVLEHHQGLRPGEGA